MSIMALEMEEIASLYRISSSVVAYETFRGTTRDIYSLLLWQRQRESTILFIYEELSLENR